MSAIPGLKKKLKSVRATGKLSKAMKTVSAVKYSKLSAAQKNYALYCSQFRFLYQDTPQDQADAIVVMGSNRGFCGGFNNEICSWYQENCNICGNTIVCGEELQKLFSDTGLPFSGGFAFDDIPQFEQCTKLMNRLSSLAGGKQFQVQLVYPQYINTMTYQPCARWFTLNASPYSTELDDYVFLPDREQVLTSLYEKACRSLIYEAVLTTALGAQAATLMTMRSAYDNAVEYTEALEGKIHRLRQSEVTSDVIESSSERVEKGDSSNG